MAIGICWKIITSSSTSSAKKKSAGKSEINGGRRLFFRGRKQNGLWMPWLTARETPPCLSRGLHPLQKNATNNYSGLEVEGIHAASHTSGYTYIQSIIQCKNAINISIKQASLKPKRSTHRPSCKRTHSPLRRSGMAYGHSLEAHPRPGCG